MTPWALTTHTLLQVGDPSTFAERSAGIMVSEINANGTVDLGKRRSPARYLMAGEDCPHGHLEDAGSRSAHGPATQHRRRRARGLGRARRRASRRLRLSTRFI